MACVFSRISLMAFLWLPGDESTETVKYRVVLSYSCFLRLLVFELGYLHKAKFSFESLVGSC